MKYILAILFLFGVLFGTSYVYDDSPSGGADIDTDSLYVNKLVVDEAIVIDTSGTELLKDLTASHIETLPNTQQVVLNVPTDATATGGETVSFAITLDDTTTVLKGSYVAVAGGGILAGSIKTYRTGGLVDPPHVIDSAAYTLLGSDYFVSVKYTETDPCTITIPTALQVDGTTFIIKDSGFNAGNKNITLTCEDGADEIEGSTSDYIIPTNGMGVNLKWDATVDSWLVW